MQIRDERPGDAAAVRRVNERAFGQPDEANLVEALHAAHAVVVSLVAKEAGEIVGHILFSPVTIDSPAGSWSAVGLAPMSVLPERQRRGIGSALVREGLTRCAAAGENVAFVLGHPDYYPRFGFVPAAPLGLSSEYDVPEEAFMVAELRPGALAGRRGRVRYHSTFAGV